MAIQQISINQALELGVKYQNKGNLDSACELYKKILLKQPLNSEALHLLGVVYFQKQEYKKAIESINKAILIDSKKAKFYYNLAIVYDAIGEEDKSAENYLKILNLELDYPYLDVVYFNLGVYYKDKGEFEKALEYYEKAIKLNSEFYDAIWNRGLILLLFGNLEKGFKDYEYRFKKKSPTDKRVFSKPAWNGENLNGKRILVLSEQGFGDSIQFIRYLKFLKQKGAYVILECKKELKRLFENSPYVDKIIEKPVNSFRFNFDYYVYLMSLPRILNTDINNVPNSESYLKPIKEISENFKNKLGNKKFKIGICWSGNPKQENDKKRSLVFNDFKSIFSIKNANFISLQLGEGLKQLKNHNIIDLSGEINDFADTAGIISNLDLVISSDTSVAHLAGALGKPVWLIVNKFPDWRWLLYRNDSPWYSSMRIFRQRYLNDWKGVFKDIKKELKKFVD